MYNSYVNMYVLCSLGKKNKQIFFRKKLKNIVSLVVCIYYLWNKHRILGFVWFVLICAFDVKINAEMA